MTFPRFVTQKRDAGEASAASSGVTIQSSLDIPYVNQSAAFFNAAPGVLSKFLETSRHDVHTTQNR